MNTERAKGKWKGKRSACEPMGWIASLEGGGTQQLRAKLQLKRLRYRVKEMGDTKGSEECSELL